MAGKVTGVVVVCDDEGGKVHNYIYGSWTPVTEYQFSSHVSTSAVVKHLIVLDTRGMCRNTASLAREKQIDKRRQRVSGK